MLDINLYECDVIVLTTKQSFEKRKDWIELIQIQFKKTKLFYNLHYLDETEETIKKWSDIKFYHRMPTLNKSEILGGCSLTIGHLKIYDYIIENKLDNVLVLEDDSFILPELSEDETLTLQYDSNSYFINLSPQIYKNKKNETQVVNGNAIFYPKYEKVLEIRNKIRNNPTRLKQIDYMLKDMYKNYGFVNSFQTIFGQPNSWQSSHNERKHKHQLHIYNTYLLAKEFYNIN